MLPEVNCELIMRNDFYAKKLYCTIWPSDAQRRNETSLKHFTEISYSSMMYILNLSHTTRPVLFTLRILNFYKFHKIQLFSFIEESHRTVHGCLLNAKLWQRDTVNGADTMCLCIQKCV